MMPAQRMFAAMVSVLIHRKIAAIIIPVQQMPALMETVITPLSPVMMVTHAQQMRA
jgi:hypothetical protein